MFYHTMGDKAFERSRYSNTLYSILKKSLIAMILNLKKLVPYSCGLKSQ